MFNYMDELVKIGKLQHTIAYPERAERKKYVTVADDFNFNVFSEEALLEFCKVPRRSREIAKHFCITTKKLSLYLHPLKDMLETKTHNGDEAKSLQKFMTAETEYDKI